jgi:hypothetical protein
MKTVLTEFFMTKSNKKKRYFVLTCAIYSMDNHGGVVLYLVEQLKYQEWKETAIAYAFLLREGALSEQELDDVCEKFLRDLSSKGGLTGERESF